MANQAGASSSTPLVSPRKKFGEAPPFRSVARTPCDHSASLSSDLAHIPAPDTPCNRCHHPSENWLCLSCKDVLCSRFVNKHMLQHFHQTSHCLALSYSDLSVWCYACDSYLDARAIMQLKPVSETAYILKFGEAPPFCSVARTPCDHSASLSSDLAHIPAPDTPCNRCHHPSENWLCLSCKDVLCSRFVNKHMLQHFHQTSHCLALSYSDLSVWCYACDSYLDARAIMQLKPVSETAYILKFGGAPPFCSVARTPCDHSASLSSDLAHIPAPDTPCNRCHHPSENWLCLSCKDVLCSRFVNKHMLQHFHQTSHCLALSYSDLSVWCYACDSYLDAQAIMQLKPVSETAYILKFGGAPPFCSVARTPCDHSASLSSDLAHIPAPDTPCNRCHHPSENWLCLSCKDVLCSRFVNKHMLQHFHQTSHCLALSYSDLSVWCYACDSYLDARAIMQLKPVSETAYILKFGGAPPFCSVARTPCDHSASLSSDLAHIPAPDTPCNRCHHPSENWLCLSCKDVLCSRFVNKHMLQHFHQTSHCLALSYSDLSVWCYACDSYLDAQAIMQLKPVSETAYILKFGGAPPFCSVARTPCDHSASLSSDLAHIPAPDTPCNRCHHPSENWLCLSCKDVLCSRFVNKHMLQHFHQTSHCLALSYSDLSVWCYACDSYLDARAIMQLKPVSETAYILKFGGAPPFCSVARTPCDHSASLSSDLAHIPAPDTPCNRCHHPSENWLCLSCKDVLCSRFVNKHMLQHFHQTSHCLALSYSDLSVWCYACDSYLDAQAIMQLKPVSETAYILKFGGAPPFCSVARTPCDHSASLSSDLAHIPAPDTPCNRCHHPSENWLCLSCKDVLCSRFVNKHMLQHFHQTSHCLALSYSDLSVWCYACDSYLDARAIMQLKPVSKTAYILKFGEAPPFCMVARTRCDHSASLSSDLAHIPAPDTPCNRENIYAVARW